MMVLNLFLAFCCLDFCFATTNTSRSCDQHVMNTTWIAPSRDSECFYHVTCRLRAINELGQLSSSPAVLVSLDISRNSLTDIKEYMFHKYKNLVVLNLSYNAIREIYRNAFIGLKNLENLDLSFNLLYKWDTLDITKQLQSLTKLNVTGNPLWLPGRHIRDLPNISSISGVTSHTLQIGAGKQYFVCNLHKNDGMKYGEEQLVTVNLGCFTLIFYFGANFTAIWHPNFSVTCEGRHWHQVFEPPSYNKTGSEITIEFIDFCYEGIQTWGLPNIPIGLATMFINFVVMATIALTPSLFKKANMVLFACMALGDLLQGLWLVVLTCVRSSMSSLQYYDKKPVICYGLFALFLTAQSTSVLTSLAVTIERYLCIVYSTKPAIRITRKMAAIILVLIWVIAIGIAGTPVGLQMVSPFFDYSCINLHRGDGLFFVHSVTYVTLVAYVISYVLYARIFWTVRRSSLNTGIQREGRLAKRIITVISTNLLFLFAPIIAGQVLVALYKVSWETRFICWNAVLFWFLGVNSFVNPVLYAFRIEIFRRSLKRFLKGRRNDVGPAASDK